jgi:hypothetical protein
MARIEQKQSLFSNNFPIDCIAETQKPQDYASLLYPVSSHLFDVFGRVDCRVFPSVDKVGIEDANRSTDD